MTTPGSWLRLLIKLSAVGLSAAAATADETGARDAAAHAPIGVMGDHVHKAGEWMWSYRFMRMTMAGNRKGGNAIEPDAIATTEPNRFFGRPMQPPTLRIAPIEMNMDMHMVGVMHAPANWLTLMAMGRYIEKDMSLMTYQGPRGVRQRGRFKVKTEGLGDLRFFGLIKLHDDGARRWHLNVGFSAPTGSTKERSQALAPSGERPTLRAPYAMQLGSGTWDLLPGITYNDGREQWRWGGQYLGGFRLGRNDEGYALGDWQELTAWLSYQWRPFISASVRLQYHSAKRITGMDPMIAAPVQTADPDNYGGDAVILGLGLNMAGQTGALAGHRLALEAGLPLRRDLHGVQLETDWTLTGGWQYSF